MLVTILIIAAIATTVGFILYKKGDQDGDGDVDLKDIKSSAKKEVREVKKRVKRVKEALAARAAGGSLQVLQVRHGAQPRRDGRRCSWAGP